MNKIFKGAYNAYDRKMDFCVEDNYMSNVLEMLHGLQGVVIDAIKLNPDDKTLETDFVKFQISSMKRNTGQ